MNFLLLSQNIDNLQSDIEDFEYYFGAKLHNIEGLSFHDLKSMKWSIIWLNRKNAILISSKGLIEFLIWKIYTTKYYILLPNNIILLSR
jgi:hypothetical protein